MKRLVVEPLDVLMFRSERPFTAIESHVAKLGVISPQTFEGALKTKIFIEFCHRKGYSPSVFQRNKKQAENEGDFKSRLKRDIENDAELREILELIGHPAINSNSKFNVIGVFPAQKEEKKEYFPVPKNIVQEDKENGTERRILPFKKIKLSGTELNVALSPSYSKIKEVEGLMELNELKRYLWGEIPKIKNKHYYIKEVRSGIQMERRTRTTVKGALYAAEFLRLVGEWGFIAWYESPYDTPDGLIRLGGEGKGATYENITEINVNEKLNSDELVKMVNEDKIFKVYLATPSYFSGCVPPKDRLEKILGVRLKQTTAILGKPVYIGGYDFAMNKEKTLQRWVDAGAVYYYTFEGKISTDLNLPLKIIDKDIDMRCAFIGGEKNV